MNYLERGFNELISELKDLGYTVYLHDHRDSNLYYGWVVSGNCFIYFQVSPGEGIELSLETTRYGVGVENKEIPMFVDDKLNPDYMDWCFNQSLDSSMRWSSFEEFWDKRCNKFGWKYIKA